MVEAGPADEMFRPSRREHGELPLSSVPEMDRGRLGHLVEPRGVDNIGEAAKPYLAHARFRQPKAAGRAP